jgi:nucleotide-binding universal stress UspA family protein
MKILVAYRDTKESQLALELAKTHSRYFDAEILLVSSSEGGKGEDPEEISKMTMRLEEIKTALVQEGIPCEVTQLARGLSPGEDIVFYADENHVDMIYVGIQKKSRTSKLLLGSTAQYIILKASCPVISVKL